MICRDRQSIEQGSALACLPSSREPGATHSSVRYGSVSATAEEPSRSRQTRCEVATLNRVGVSAAKDQRRMVSRTRGPMLRGSRCTEDQSLIIGNLNITQSVASRFANDGIRSLRFTKTWVTDQSVRRSTVVITMKDIIPRTADGRRRKNRWTIVASVCDRRGLIGVSGATTNYEADRLRELER